MYSQMFDHALDVLAGWNANLDELQCRAKLAAAVVKSPVYAGSCVSLNSSAEFVPGVAGHDMPIFLLNASDDFDVSNPGGTRWQAISPTGVMSGMVACRGYEVATTEFDTTDTYAVNALLTSPTEAVVGAGYETQAGKLYRRKSWQGGANAALVLYTDPICGVVSGGGKQTNHNNVSTLSFWTVYLPV
jgi:hypothetical protein